jgi:hypothetical protein
MCPRWTPGRTFRRSLQAYLRNAMSRSSSNPSMPRVWARKIAGSEVEIIGTGYVYTYTVPMNITLSIDEKVVARARKKAKTMGKSLNELIREYLHKLAGGDDPERSIEEFEHLSGRGHSRGWCFSWVLSRAPNKRQSQGCDSTPRRAGLNFKAVSSYQTTAALTSANASGWISSGLAPIEQVADLTAGLGPRNGLHFARIEVLNSPGDFF